MWNKDKTYDVIVAGAGPSGIAAAVASARMGARTLLLEQNARPGGVAVSCNCPGIMGCSYNREKQLITGVGEELVRRLSKRGAAMLKHDLKRYFENDPILEDIVSSEDDIALEATRMLSEAGVDYLGYCTVYGCKLEGRKITELQAFCAGENLKLQAEAFVDGIGDALLAHLAGLPIREASENELMTKTIMIRVRNQKLFAPINLKERFKALHHTFPYPAQDSLMLHPSGMHGDYLLNITLIGGNSFSPSDLTRMDSELREQIPVIIEWLRINIPEFKDCILEAAAPCMGVRNGRTIIARENITCQDLDEDTPVSEPVAVGFRHYGGHGISNFVQSWAKSNPGMRDIPYGALLSPECDNYVVGGRAIGIEPKAITAIRLMAQCFATGQAAGTIAALASKGKALPQYPELRKELLQQGLLIEH